MQKNTGIRRLVKATFYSYKGIRYALRHEEAFRTEVVGAIVLLPVAVLVDVTALERLLLIIPIFLVLIVELVNTAIEAAIDRIGPERHKLSGVAKDTGSAAVLLSLILLVIIWVVVLL